MMIRKLIINNNNINLIKNTNFLFNNNKSFFSTHNSNNNNINKIINNNNDILNKNNETIDNNINNVNNNNKNNKVHNPVLQVFLENLYRIPQHQEALKEICKYENKETNEDFAPSASNYSPYLQMIGLSSNILKSQLESLAVYLQTLRQGKLIRASNYDDSNVEHEVHFALKEFFESLNKRDKEKIKQYTSGWMFSVMDQMGDDLKLCDSHNASFKFYISKITSSQQGTLQLFQDKTFLGYHFKLVGDICVNSFKQDHKEFQCSVVFQRNINDNNWRVAYIDPSVFSFITIEKLVPGF